MNGIDVSKWNGLINWGNVKNSGVDFAILKATKKNNEKEESFETNYNGCVTNSLPCGVYRYVYAKNEKEAKEEANALLKAINDKSITCGVWLDLEDSSLVSLGKDTLTKIINAENDVLKAAGYKVGIYCNKYWYDSILDSKNLKNAFPFWIARYPANDNGTIRESLSPKDYAICWQYSSKGSMNGIDGNVDLNKSFVDLPTYMSGTYYAKPNTKTGEGLAEYAISKIGTPYFYGAKMQVLTEKFMKSMHNQYPAIVTEAYMQKARDNKQVGKVNVDCSGLIGAYREKQIGSSQLYATASRRLPIEDVDKFAIGTVLWKQGHVGVKVSDTECVEAKGINYGTIKSKISATKWKYGLTFDDMNYTYGEKVAGTTKGKNPYKEPARLLKKGCKGDDVKWLQFELVESGYQLDVDGDFGTITKNKLILFQKSCKIEADGICGKITISKLKAE